MDIKPECDAASDPSLFTINSDHVLQFLQPHNCSQLVAELQEELAMSKECSLNEEVLSDAEAKHWCVDDDMTPSLEAGLSYFEQAAVIENKA